MAVDPAERCVWQYLGRCWTEIEAKSDRCDVAGGPGVELDSDRAAISTDQPAALPPPTDGMLADHPARDRCSHRSVVRLDEAVGIRVQCHHAAFCPACVVDPPAVDACRATDMRSRDRSPYCSAAPAYPSIPHMSARRPAGHFQRTQSHAPCGCVPVQAPGRSVVKWRAYPFVCVRAI